MISKHSDFLKLTSLAGLPVRFWSETNRSSAINVPDFTADAWKVNKPNMDINLERGGNTGIRLT